MMNKQRSSRLQLGKYLFAVPIIALFFTMSRAAHLPDVSEHTTASGSAGNPTPTAEPVAQPSRTVSDTTKTKRAPAVKIIGTVSDIAEAPLMVLDGKGLEKGFDIKTIDATTIDRVEVFKDSSATAMFGERGAHGAVLITTKAKAKKDAARRDVVEILEIQVVGYGTKDVTKGKSAAGGDFNGALVVIDGDESTVAALRQLSPHDIKAIDVLKGKAATDKYGDKGKKGVMEVTTDKGK